MKDDSGNYNWTCYDDSDTRYVTIYQNKDFGGKNGTYGVTGGRVFASSRTPGEDSASSIKVPKGLKITLYTDDDGEGGSIELGQGDYPSLSSLPFGEDGGTWNDRVSAFKVERA